MSTILDKPIEFTKGVGPQRADLLKKELGIFTVGDLLLHYPFRYVDRTQIYPIREIISDAAYVQIRGQITHLEEVGHHRAKRLVATFRDDSGQIDLVWFKGLKWISRSIQAGMEYVVFGKPSAFNGSYNIVHPEMEPAAEFSTESLTGWQPVYPSTEKLKTRGLDSRGLEKLLRVAVAELKESDFPENLPEEMIRKYKFPSRYEALLNIHRPRSEQELVAAQRRIKFEEFFFIQLRMLQLKVGRHEISKGFVFEDISNHFAHFYKDQLKFELTNAQKRVIREIRKDVLSGHQMNRLLQGDVGSGKTIVALMSQLMAVDNGFQAALMAPTEILAQQHYATLTEYLGKMDVTVALLTGSVKGKERKLILGELEAGNIDILIGTHALIEDAVQFKQLGLVVIDEQQRFGVEQRARLWRKNDSKPPHILVMTATPIPRTLAMTVYGDLDTSVIDELPPGRKPITTYHYYDSARLKLFEFMRKEIAQGRQVYVVYPLIQESEKMDYKDLMDGYESISRAFPPPRYQVSIVHGQMKADAKDYEMQRFINRQTQIMVATTVIEVGVNVPNASIMVIESAERFGLAQLHQLRGRVGRGADQSYCILMSGHKLSSEGKKRLETMVATNDGFEIAEVDMRLRGPGDIEGTQQSGVLNLRLADIVKDSNILQGARQAAMELINADPALEKPENLALRRYLQQEAKQKKAWSKIS